MVLNVADHLGFLLLIGLLLGLFPNSVDVQVAVLIAEISFRLEATGQVFEHWSLQDIVDGNDFNRCQIRHDSERFLDS